MQSQPAPTITVQPSSAFEASWHDDATQRQRDQVAAETLATIRAIADDDAQPGPVRRMADYIGEYLFDPELDFDGIIASAKSDETEPGDLALLFSEHTGHPPLAFVEHHRFQVALGLIASSNLTLAAATELAGFPSLTRFERAGASVTSSQVRVVADQHRRAARSVPAATIESTLRQLAQTHTGPQLHALIAYLLGILPAMSKASEDDLES